MQRFNQLARKPLYQRILRRIKPFYQVPVQLGRALWQNPQALDAKVRYIFIFSHMRCYTSLLAHLLGSHPEISGYYEQHRSYRSPFDLFLMRLDIAEGTDYHFRGRFALDKILTMHCEVSPSILQRDDVFTIFTIRKPEASIKSISVLPQIQTPEFATDYYCHRLQYLTSLAQLPMRKMYFDGEALVEQSEATLRHIKDYLGLTQPLSTQYESFKHTGKNGYGDFSSNLKSGEIQKNASLSRYENIVVAPPLIERATRAYSDAREKLQKACEIH